MCRIDLSRDLATRALFGKLCLPTRKASSSELVAHCSRLEENNEPLAKLKLRDNPIGDEGAEPASKALINNNALKELRLGKRIIGDEGAAAIA